MKTVIFLMALMCLVSTAYAITFTDYPCWSDCVKKGYAIELCNKQCEY